MIRSPFAYSVEYLAAQPIAATPFRIVGSTPTAGDDVLREDQGHVQLQDGVSDLLAESGATTPFCYVDPDAATLVLAPGISPSSGPPTLSVFQGYSDDFAIQCWNRGSLSAPAFSAADQLSAAIYRSGTAAPTCQPAAGWYNAGSGRGQIVCSVSTAQSALLQPTVPYRLIVAWVPATDDTRDVVIVRLPIVVERIY